MELGLLNLMSPAGANDETGTLAPGAVDADAFAKLIAQLGLAPTSGEAAGATPENLAARLAAAVPTATSAATATSLTAETAEDEGIEGTTPEQGGLVDLATLGLPPLVAALVAPTAAAPSALAATVGTGSKAGLAGRSTDGTMPSPIAADSLLAAAQPKVDATVDKRAAPVELPTPLAALVSAAVPRRSAPTSLPVAPTQPGASDAVAAVPLDTASSPVLQAPTPVPILSAAPTDAAPTVATSQPVQVAELMAEQQLDLARGGEWLDQLAKDIARASSTDGQLRFKLNPEHLGSLHVELTQGSAGASLRLTADSEAARAIIADARPQLIAEARAQGVRIAEAHVDLGSGGQSGQGGNTSRDGRPAPDQSYLTTWKPESAEERPTPPRRSASERYA